MGNTITNTKLQHTMNSCPPSHNPSRRSWSRLQREGCNRGREGKSRDEQLTLGPTPTISQSIATILVTPAGRGVDIAGLGGRGATSMGYQLTFHSMRHAGCCFQAPSPPLTLLPSHPYRHPCTCIAVAPHLLLSPITPISHTHVATLAPAPVSLPLLSSSFVATASTCLTASLALLA